MNRERAESYLRLVAEAELRQPTPASQAAAAAALHHLPRRQRETIALQYFAGLPEAETARRIGISPGAVQSHSTRGVAGLRAALADGTGRLANVAQVLAAVRALDQEVTDQILDDFALARAARRASPAGSNRPELGSLLRSPAAHLPLAMLMNAGPAAASATVGAAEAAGAQTAPGRVVPLGQLMAVRAQGWGLGGKPEDVYGDMHLLSYAQTASGARLTMAVRTHGQLVPPANEPSYTYRPYATFPVHQFTATDDRETRYQVGFIGRCESRVSELTGQITVRPGPPPGTRWLELASASGEPGVRLDLTRPPDGMPMTVGPPASPGEHLLHTIATRMLLLVLEFPEEIRLHSDVPVPEPFAGVADGLGDAVAALEASGALSPLSPVPGQLAALCASLNITGHGITAPPARDLPPPWLSMLAHYLHRRPRAAVDDDGCAALAVTFPGLDGISLAILGLHNSAGRTFLLAQASGLAPEGYDGRLGIEPHLPLSIWIRDSGGGWHATRARGWAGADHSEATMRLRVLPPLSRDATWIDVLVAGRSAEVRATLPLRWQ